MDNQNLNGSVFKILKLHFLFILILFTAKLLSLLFIQINWSLKESIKINYTFSKKVQNRFTIYLESRVTLHSAFKNQFVLHVNKWSVLQTIWFAMKPRKYSIHYAFLKEWHECLKEKKIGNAMKQDDVSIACLNVSLELHKRLCSTQKEIILSCVTIAILLFTSIVLIKNRSRWFQRSHRKRQLNTDVRTALYVRTVA